MTNEKKESLKQDLKELRSTHNRIVDSIIVLESTINLLLEEIRENQNALTDLENSIDKL